jgi:hypothetical protein
VLTLPPRANNMSVLESLFPLNPNQRPELHKAEKIDIEYNYVIHIDSMIYFFLVGAEKVKEMLDDIVKSCC